jgi:hypothetical protein
MALAGALTRRNRKPAKHGSISFLKRQTRNLCWSTQPDDRHVPKKVKVFGFFLSKKNCFLGACLSLEVSRLQCRLV